jgi:hypothetical protein
MPPVRANTVTPHSTGGASHSSLETAWCLAPAPVGVWHSYRMVSVTAPLGVCHSHRSGVCHSYRLVSVTRADRCLAPMLPLKGVWHRFWHPCTYTHKSATMDTVL